jgi:ubiquinol-cytochrome c reductase cytochrome b subunit
MRVLKSNTVLNWLYNEAVSYPTPASLSFFWSFGIMGLICLISQIISGIFLAMHYIPSAEFAFTSVEHIMWDVRGGWMLRYLHANGASMFFLVIYLHICRGLYYNSFAGKREFVWYTGVIIIFLMILTAFLGYVLPWGQMSFWAATVITSLASAIPYIGDSIVAWLWGGFSVGEQTLVRFFSLHYLLPFVLVALVGAHIVLLHETGSNTPTTVGLIWGDRITFGPYFFLKDLYYIIIFFVLFLYFVLFNSNLLGHPDNYIPAMYMSTPAHIVPEWYFLPFYALLRSVPNKLGGVTVMVLSIIGLALLPILVNSSTKRLMLTSNFNAQRSLFFSFFISNVILLGWIGGQPIEEPMYTVGQLSSIAYFFLIFLIFPSLNYLMSFIFDPILKYKAVWEFLYTVSEFFRPVVIGSRVLAVWVSRFWLRLDAKEYMIYNRGFHPEYEWSRADYTWDRSKKGFKKNIVQPWIDFLLDLTWNENKVYANIKLKQLDFLITALNASYESEAARIKLQDEEKNQAHVWFKKHPLVLIFKHFFPDTFFEKYFNLSFVDYPEYNPTYVELLEIHTQNLKEVASTKIKIQKSKECFNTKLNYLVDSCEPTD